MFSKNQQNAGGKNRLEDLKRKQQIRRRNGLLLVAAFQITSLVVTYYLGRSSRKKK